MKLSGMPADQEQTIRQAEYDLRLGPTALARELGVPKSTLRDWKAGKHRMPGIAYRCIELLRIVRANEQTKPYDIGDSNARQNEYWQRVGGHPAPGEYDTE